MMWRDSPRCDHQPTIEKASRDETGLAVTKPVVDKGRGSPGKYVAGACEIQTTMLEREIALRRIEGDLHANKCTPI
jgi:hypothetical protein